MFHTPNKEMICPHCQVKGQVVTRKIPKMRAYRTPITQAKCKNCKNQWEF